MVAVATSTNAQTLPTRGSRVWTIAGIPLALALMALSANCFLKYLWWTACYSAWSGIPKMAEQWKAAGAHASFNGWSFVFLEASSFILLSSVFRFKIAARIIVALASTIVCTAIFALALSWIKQGIQ